jgi:hypothetical protein
MDLLELFDNHLDALDYLSDCEIGQSLDGEPILSFKKIAKKLKAEGYDPYDAIDRLNIILAPLQKSRGVIILYDID